MVEASVTIRMNIPYLDLKAVTALHGEEIQKAVAEVVGGGWYLQGAAVQQFEQHYAAYIGTRHCVGVANGLDALTLTLRAYKEMGRIGEGDEVLVPANTFIATVLAITENGLTPVFIDVDADTLDLNLDQLQQSLTSKTKALMLVHLYGRCTYNESIRAFCQANGLLLIEDNAQAHGCAYLSSCTPHGQLSSVNCHPSTLPKIGSLGNVACHSFYPGKNLGALGDGGAVTTDDEELAQIIRSIANYGFEKKYVAAYKGRNSRLDEVQAAVLDVKLRYLDEDNDRRQAIAHAYYTHIQHETIHMPRLMKAGTNVYHIFPVFTPHRDALQRYLQEKGIHTLIHYPVPPYRQTCYREYNHLTLPVTERLAREELSLPLHPALTDVEVSYIIETLNSFSPTVNN